MPIRPMLLALAVASAAMAPAAQAAGLDPAQSNPAATKPANPDFDAGKAAVERKDFAGAIPALRRAVAADAKNPDALNLLGYATRMSGDPRGSLQHYNAALALDPKHLGAHEYVGEAYLMLGDIAKAEEHLAQLDRLCLFGCREYRMLKDAIAAAKQGKRPGG